MKLTAQLYHESDLWNFSQDITSLKKLGHKYYYFL
jgi:hypothetical protein